MTILDTLKKQRLHINYALIILTIIAIGYALFSQKPKEVVKTLTETKFVDRNIVKVQKQFIDRIIVKTDKDGSVTTTTEKVTNEKDVTDKSKAGVTFISQTTTKYLSRYTLSTFYPLPLTLTNIPKFNPFDVTIMGGARVFSTPLFLNLGTNVGLNQLLVGFTIEF